MTFTHLLTVNSGHLQNGNTSQRCTNIKVPVNVTGVTLISSTLVQIKDYNGEYHWVDSFYLEEIKK